MKRVEHPIAEIETPKETYKWAWRGALLITFPLWGLVPLGIAILIYLACGGK